MTTTEQHTLHDLVCRQPISVAVVSLLHLAIKMLHDNPDGLSQLCSSEH